MIGRAHHLQDERLFDCYVAQRSGEAADPPSAEHLADCTECGARYRELVQFMDGLRDEADAETDAIFTPEQLRLQQQQIARRIEHLGHPARVLSFPARLVSRHFSRHAGRIAPRVAAAAAVAGLFVGVGVGIIFDSRTRVMAPVVMTAPTAAPIRIPASIAAMSAPVIDDDTFLSELEAVVGGPHNLELLPFDTLTPRVREISSRPLEY